MADNETVTVYVTKHAISGGIQKITVQRNENNPDLVTWTAKGWRYYADKGDWHLTVEEAVLKAEEMRQKKLRSLEKNIKKIQSINFAAMGIKVIESDMEA